MKEEKLEQEVGILDILLDEDNEDPITLYDENDKAIQFDQVAIIPMDEKLYAILKPIDEMEGVAEDVAREAIRLASHKLPIKCKFVKKEDQEA
jgi:hypothetical protein